MGRDVRVQHVLELIARLKQICNADPKTGQSSKMDDIRQRIDMLAWQGNRAIVFSQYTNSGFGVAAVAEALKQFNPLSFTGDLDLDERRSVIQRFRADDRHKALIVSLEERIDRILEAKQDLFDELVDDVSIDLGASLTAGQLFGLFGLERPA